jgi:3-hydroxyisobutyrate dehydrogenase-like beta-hydroxyacid dehydrogenase
MSVVAFLGLGRMGTAMAGNLLRAGHDVVVWNRTTAKAHAFAGLHGGRSADTPGAGAEGAEFVVTMLADDTALRDVYHGPSGILARLRPGTIAVDMSTVSPGTVQEIAAQVAAADGTFIDAPVSGSVAAAADASLTIMTAGEESAVDQARGVLGAMGNPVIYLGPSGRGSIMKLCVNVIVHSLNGAVAESLVLAEKSGIERAQAYEVFLNSAIAAPFVRYRQAAFETPGEVPAAFRLDLAAKDLRLALEAASRAGATLPQSTVNLSLLSAAVRDGYGDHDESALAVHYRSYAP